MQIINSEIENLINAKIEQGKEQFGDDFKNLVLEIIALEKLTALPVPICSKDRNLVPLSKWNDYHKIPSAGTLRQWAFHNKEFRDFCIVKQGSRLLVDEEKFFEFTKPKV